MAALVRESVLKNDAGSTILVKGGLGTNSYFKNSVYQKLATNVVKDKIEEAITKKLDVRSLLATSSNTIRVADLGCAVGPNTFTCMQNIVNVVKEKYRSQCPTSEILPDFQVFFNDKTSNDFNTLFTSLPLEREYFAAGVPGSFYQRLFPESSLHVVQCHYAIFWLSKVPDELQDKDSPAWNKGKIHYASAPDEVLRAYANQWAHDFDSFLNARAKEIVPGGLLIVIMPSVPDGMPYSELANGIFFNLLASILLDMAKRGLIREEEVDGFNMPIYAAPPGEFVAGVEKNGHFNIEEIGLTNPAPWLTDDVHVDMIEFLRHIRAAWEGMFIKHFPPNIVDEIFDQLTIRLPEVFESMERAYKDKIQAHYVLQRKPYQFD
ncbi:loganic acid O-methyltransferase [Ricinus communis]|uniref:Benzoate carboxyl methyltransferase, putative n=1 Tax=Ricinus communis TaxID=3988 RepID=B9SJ35_RICCO|nr:loganic acid O-methyltransferase [Ricinus communis]EEF36428.1 Benzoate carboxyl methyltransferase, putative [Ricinus communis]|eukprot:XP_002526004.1 probable S-adenosylmethionine-dependent methyltransferase At5g38100 [Ricinus communis]